MAGTVHEHERTALLQDAETRAYPAVFRGLVKAWPATTLWKGLEGLSYLKAAAGHATVQVSCRVREHAASRARADQRRDDI